MTRRDESVRRNKDAVLAEHRALREILARMREAEKREDLVARLLEFRSATRQHFDGEEAPGGFYENVILSAPRHQAALEDLREEHGRFLMEAERLTLTARECPDEELDRLRTDVRSLVERLDDHEARENEILLEVMNTDLGAGD